MWFFYLYNYLILLLNIISLPKENATNPKLRITKVVNNTVPALGNSTGGSVSLKTGVTSDVLL